MKRISELRCKVADSLIENVLAARKSAGHSKFKPEGK